MKNFIRLIVVAILLITCKPSKVEVPELLVNVNLKNNVKWKANIDTNKGIAKMIKLSEAFYGSNYNELSEKLSAEFTTIFQKCTMKGEAHKQLHNYLIPLNDIITKLANTNKKEQLVAYAQLSPYLKQYYNYFE